MTYTIYTDTLFRWSVSTDTASEPVRLPSLGACPEIRKQSAEGQTVRSRSEARRGEGQTVFVRFLVNKSFLTMWAGIVYGLFLAGRRAAEVNAQHSMVKVSTGIFNGPFPGDFCEMLRDGQTVLVNFLPWETVGGRYVHGLILAENVHPEL